VEIGDSPPSAGVEPRPVFLDAGFLADRSDDIVQPAEAEPRPTCTPNEEGARVLLPPLPPAHLAPVVEGSARLRVQGSPHGAASFEGLNSDVGLVVVVYVQVTELPSSESYGVFESNEGVVPRRSLRVPPALRRLLEGQHLFRGEDGDVLVLLRLRGLTLFEGPGMTQCAEEGFDDVIIPPQGPPPCASSAEAGKEPVHMMRLEGILLPRVSHEEPLSHLKVSTDTLPAPG